MDQPIGERLLNSLECASFSMAVSMLLAFPLGIVAAVKKGAGVDRAARVWTGCRSPRRGSSA